MIEGNGKRRIRFIGIHFTGIALEIWLVLKQHFSENGPGTTGIRITRKVIHTLSPIFQGRPIASGSLGMGLGNVFLKSPLRGSYVYSEAHRRLHQEIQVAGEHALILLLKLQAAGPQS